MDDSRSADVPGPGNLPHRGRDSQPIGTATSVNQDAWVQAVLDAAVEGMIIIDEQVLLNLIRNAVEAVQGRPQRVVSVITRLMATETGPPKIEVEVRDTGVGLADEDVPNVFEAFFTTKPDGMGMGLAICRSIVEAHDGKMFAAAGPDGGASFRFTLPVGEG